MKLSKALLTLVICVASCVNVIPAQTPARSLVSRPARIANADSDASDLLPASDIVVDIRVGRMLNDLIPRVLAGAPKQRAELDRMLALVVERTGFDVRSIDRVIMGMPVPPNLHSDFATGAATKLQDALVIVQGRFDADALASAASLFLPAAPEQHAGRSLFTFQADASLLRRLGVPETSIGTPPPMNIAFAAARSDVLIYGSPASVRRGLEDSTDSNERNAEARSWGARRPGNLFSMWVNAEAMTESINTASRAQAATGKAERGLSNDPIGGSVAGATTTQSSVSVIASLWKPLETARRFYMSIGSEGGNVDTLVVAQMRTPEDARVLGESISGFLKMLRGSASQASSVAKNPFDSLRVTNTNDEVRLEGRLSEVDLAASARVADKRRTAATGAAPRPARRARPRR